MSRFSAIKAGRAFVEFFIDSRQAVGEMRQFDRYITARLRNMGTQIASIGRQMTLVGGAMTLPLTLFAREAANVNVQMMRFEKAFGGGAAKMEQFAQAVENMTGFNKRTIQAGLVRLNAFMKSMGMNAPDAAAASREMVQAAADLAAASPEIRDIDEAVNRLISGLRGEEALEEFANTKLVALNDELKKVGKNVKTASELEKLVARMALIQKDFAAGGIFGTAGETMGMEAGQIRKFTSSLKEIRIELGRVVLLFGAELVGSVSVALRWFTQFLQSNKETAKRLIAMVAGVTALGAAFMGLGLAIQLVGSLWPVLLAGAVGVVQAFDSMEDVMESVGKTLSSLKIRFDTLIKAMRIQDSVKSWEFLREALKIIFEDIADMAEVAFRSGGMRASSAFLEGIEALNEKLGGSGWAGQAAKNAETLAREEERLFRMRNKSREFQLKNLGKLMDRELKKQEEARKKADAEAMNFGDADAGRVDEIKDAVLGFQKDIGTAGTASARTQGFFQFGTQTERVQERQLTELQKIRREVQKKKAMGLAFK